jgi:two-component system response regulator MprA
VTPAARILVVDDQAEIRDMTAKVLAGAGHAVETAGSGEAALRALRAAGFDLVLLDINMPGMDGWETLRLLRADESLGRVTVAMFSVKGEIRDKVQGLQAGATDFITKPFAVDELLERVARLIARGREARPSAASRGGAP